MTITDINDDDLPVFDPADPMMREHLRTLINWTDKPDAPRHRPTRKQVFDSIEWDSITEALLDHIDQRDGTCKCCTIVHDHTACEHPCCPDHE